MKGVSEIESQNAMPVIQILLGEGPVQAHSLSQLLYRAGCEHDILSQQIG